MARFATSAGVGLVTADHTARWCRHERPRGFGSGGSATPAGDNHTTGYQRRWIHPEVTLFKLPTGPADHPGPYDKITDRFSALYVDVWNSQGSNQGTTPRCCVAVAMASALRGVLHD